MERTNRNRFREFPVSRTEFIRLKEFELKHQKKLFDIEKRYYDNLRQHQEEITQKLKEQLSDFTRQLLVNHLKEIETELLGYQLDDSKIRDLRNEIEQLRGHDRVQKRAVLH